MQAYKTQTPSPQIEIDFSQFNQSKGRHVIDEALLNCPMEEQQVVVHIDNHPCSHDCWIIRECSFRIDSKVFLLSNISSSKSLLIHAINAEVNKDIAFRKRVTRFSLIFSGLPKSANSFDFIEPGETGWRLLNIKRNKEDVYKLKIKKAVIELIT